TDARTGGDRERVRLDVAVDRAGFDQLDPGRGLDVAFQFARHVHAVGPHAAGDLRAVLDGQVALHVDVALEAAGDADVAGTLDLALDGQVGGDHRLLGRGGRRRTRGNRWLRRCEVGVRRDVPDRGRAGVLRERGRGLGGGLLVVED